MAEAFSLDVADLTSTKRTADFALARQVAMYLSRELTDSSLQQIGYAFHKKDHTTVLHACRKIAEMIDNDARVRSVVDNIRNKG